MTQSITTQKLAILLSEYLTIYDADKNVCVHCILVFSVIRRSKRGSVRSIAGHYGEMKWRRSDQTLRLSMGQ